MRWTVRAKKPVEFATSGGTPPLTWSSPGGNPVAGRGEEYTTTYAAKGEYVVTVTDGNGVTDTLHVKVV